MSAPPQPSPLTVYSKAGAPPKPLPGVQYCMLEKTGDSAKPLAQYLKGGDVRVDSSSRIDFLPQWDTAHARAVGCVPPLVVFIRSNTPIPTIAHARDFKPNCGGIYSCPAHLAHAFSSVMGVRCIWIESPAQVKSIIKAEDPVSAAADLLASSSLSPSTFVRSVTKLMKLVVAAASSILL